ncbi:MAG TPA: AAA family ATPase [Aldersonia sp.]
MVVGRERELAELARLLDEARAGSAVLGLVQGPAGIGKSTLVRTFTAPLHDWQILAATGMPWETDRRWGVAEQLLRRPPTSDRPAEVAGEFAGLLGGPAVVAVDDAHHADPESLQALVSFAHRAPNHPLLVLLVIPDALPDDIPEASASLFTAQCANTVRVRPLTPADVAALALDRAGVGLSPWTARRLCEHTLGNPRPLVQLLDQIPRSQWQRWQATFPAPREHVGAVRRALHSCPEPARALVEAAAILGTDCTLAEAADLARLDDPVGAVDAAHGAGLLWVREDRGMMTVVLADPMTRAAIIDETTPARRRELHARAAELTEDEGARLLHLVSATPTSDADLAAALDRYGDRRAAEGAWSDSAEALITASRITPDRELRMQRLIRAVDALTGASDVPQALSFAPELEAAPSLPMRDAVLGYIAIQRGRAGEAERLLTDAWETMDVEREPQLAAVICQRMVLHSLAQLRGADLVQWADRAASLLESSAPAVVESFAIRGLGLAMTGQIEDARKSYAELPESIRVGAQNQRVRMAEGWLALLLDDPEAARPALEAAEPTAVRGGSIRISLWAQAWLARTQMTLGAWDDALRTVDRAVAQLDLAGVVLLRPLIHWTGAQLNALRGDRRAAEKHLHLGRAASDDYPIMLAPACIAAGQYAEAESDYGSVLRHLEPLIHLRDRASLDEPGCWPWTDLYGNALVMTGRVDEADEFLRPHEELALARGHRSSMARLGYVRGRIHGARGEIDEARDSFESALDKLSSLPMPYARARVNFAYGQTMRRAGRRREADSVLRTARELFTTLGAQAYVARCDRELKAGGLRAGADDSARSTLDVTALTPQERAVTTLVAAGHTNKKVAEELFLSVKTVQYHLTRVYAKLGVRSRSELAAQFRDLEPDAT